MQRVVLITGASSGIGRAAAIAFVRAGYRVAGTARRAEKLAELETLLPGDFLPITADVRDPSALQAAVEQVVSQYGRLDVLVANAGLGQRGGIVESDWEDIETLLRTNIDGVLHSIRAAVPAIRNSGVGGHIVLVSSVVWNMTLPYAANYAASKAFVSNLARSLRLELESDGIGVTDMRVGRTETEFSQKRLGQSGRAEGAGRIPVMSAEQVADTIVEAVQHKRQAVAVRWFDRLVMLANRLLPEFIGRRALRQYR